MTEITDEDFFQLTAYIKMKFGIHLGPEKKALVTGRLAKVIYTLNLPDISAYYKYIVEDRTGQADITLVNAITTNHTFFMRETDHFSYYKENVLPYFAENITDGDMRTWCAACSSGEEAYTLAMLIKDFFTLKRQNLDTTLLATDISLSALANAKGGVYSQEAVSTLPATWQKMYFKRKDQHSLQVQSEIKKTIIFRQFNLMNQVFPFKRKFHTIFCRNVMIYFDLATRRELTHKFHQWLEPGGYLFIGHSEVIERNAGLFKYVMPAIYRKE